MNERGLNDDDDGDGDRYNQSGDRRDGIDRRSNQRVRLKAFGGELDISGAQVITILLLLALLAGFAFFLFKHDETTHNMIEKIEALTYVVSLPQEKREQLELAMPDSLREMPRARKK